MVVSCFGPYHCLVHDDALTKCTGAILTPWAMPLALGHLRLVWAQSIGGATGTWSHHHHPPVFICQCMVCHEYVFIFASASLQSSLSLDGAPSFLLGDPGHPPIVALIILVLSSFSSSSSHHRLTLPPRLIAGGRRSTAPPPLPPPPPPPLRGGVDPHQEQSSSSSSSSSMSLS